MILVDDQRERERERESCESEVGNFFLYFKIFDRWEEKLDVVGSGILAVGC